MNEIDAMLQNKTDPVPQESEAYEITIQHMLTNSKSLVPVYASNTLGQIALGYGDLIGLKTEKNMFKFYNMQSTPMRSISDMTKPLSQFGIGPGDTLGISDDGRVAAE